MWSASHSEFPKNNIREIIIVMSVEKLLVSDALIVKKLIKIGPGYYGA